MQAFSRIIFSFVPFQRTFFQPKACRFCMHGAFDCLRIMASKPQKKDGIAPRQKRGKRQCSHLLCFVVSLLFLPFFVL